MAASGGGAPGTLTFNKDEIQEKVKSHFQNKVMKVDDLDR